MDRQTSLERDLRKRGDTDWQTGFVTALLLTLITFGIYGAYVLYKLLERREQHFERMASLRGNLIAVLQERARTSGIAGDLDSDFAELRRIDIEASDRDRRGDKTPVLWLVLGIFTGVTNFYVYYFLNDDFHDHEDNESLFFDKAAALMARIDLGWKLPQPATTVPRRRFTPYLIFTLLTLGLFALYWWYTLITDVNRHFDYHRSWEPLLRDAIGYS